MDKAFVTALLANNPELAKLARQERAYKDVERELAGNGLDYSNRSVWLVINQANGSVKAKPKLKLKLS